MINYYCPDFYHGRKIYENIVKYQKEYPEYFYENVNIRYIFGSFPNMIWNGGSILLGPPMFLSDIQDFKNFYEELNIPIQLTLTNSSLTEEHLEDYYCNLVLENFNNGQNEVLVSSPILEDYLRKYYPNYKINRSVVNTPDDYDWEKALDTKYHNIVMPKRHGKNLNFLKTIKKEYRNRIEIMCSEICPIDCPFLYQHYKEFEKFTLDRNQNTSELPLCKNTYIKNSLFHADINNFISYKEINNNYLPLGYTEFKLTGRGDKIRILATLLSYMVKQEYQLLFMQKFLKENLL